MQDATTAWLRSLASVLQLGDQVSPRGQRTKELPQRTTIVDMRRPVVRVELRKLSYQFMAAEAYWILSGDDQVATIEPYNANIAKFSDDGVKFFGAYGPKIHDQLDYVINKLLADRDTRQAGLTIWRENPPETKDVPCTVAIFASIRGTKLNLHVFMRSSDVWLGVPYDVFNFSMLGHLICTELNRQLGFDVCMPGTLYLTAASSHLYERNWEQAAECALVDGLEQPETPAGLIVDGIHLMNTLKALRDTKPGDPLRWWEI